MSYSSGNGINRSVQIGWVVVLFLGLGSAFVASLMYLRVIDSDAELDQKETEVSEHEVIAAMESSFAEEQVFELAWLEGVENLLLFDSLEKAISHQEAVLSLTGVDDFGGRERLNYLLERLANTKGKWLYMRVNELLEEADGLLAQENPLAALPLYEEAMESQLWLNSNLRESPYSDKQLEIRLTNQFEELKTMDVGLQVVDLMSRGERIFEEGNFEGAENDFRRALALQESIHLSAGKSVHADWGRMHRLEQGLKLIDAARYDLRIVELLAAADVDEDESVLERALRLQEMVNDRFSRTAYDNPERLFLIRERLIEGRSRAQVYLIMRQSRVLGNYISASDWASAEVCVLELHELMEVFEQSFPLSLIPDPNLNEQIEWLLSKQEVLPLLKDRIVSRLSDLPGEEGIRIFSYEVDQELYQRVMNENPSRWKGASLPVDSVGFEDAHLFCKRVGWLLGNEVSLPKLDWLEGEVLLPKSIEGLWFSECSDFTSRETGDDHSGEGISDLYGNMSEWVISEEGEVGLFGGSGSESYEVTLKNPVKWVVPNFRSRWTGFRFCVLVKSR